MGRRGQATHEAPRQGSPTDGEGAGLAIDSPWRARSVNRRSCDEPPAAEGTPCRLARRATFHYPIVGLGPGPNRGRPRFKRSAAEQRAAKRCGSLSARSTLRAPGGASTSHPVTDPCFSLKDPAPRRPAAPFPRRPQAPALPIRPLGTLIDEHRWPNVP
jgi:hypothetical protein